MVLFKEPNQAHREDLAGWRLSQSAVGTAVDGDCSLGGGEVATGLSQRRESCYLTSLYKAM